MEKILMLSVVQQHIEQQKQIKQALPIDITSRQGTVISISSDLTLSNMQRNSDTSRGSSDSDLSTEARNLNNWITVNHDIYGTRNSPQTIINRNNVATLQLKWRLINDAEIQDPPIIIGNKGYVQDYAGTVMAFDAKTGEPLWKLRVGNGPTMGLTFNNASTAFNVMF
jgi:glucose dehydrogenase